VTLDVAAGYLDVCARSVRRYVNQGRLTAYRIGPRLIKVDMAEVEALAHPIATVESPHQTTASA
jgi:excisionase family DNA binding protein